MNTSEKIYQILDQNPSITQWAEVKKIYMEKYPKEREPSRSWVWTRMRIWKQRKGAKAQPGPKTEPSTPVEVETPKIEFDFQPITPTEIPSTAEPTEQTPIDALEKVASGIFAPEDLQALFDAVNKWLPLDSKPPEGSSTLLGKLGCKPLNRLMEKYGEQNADLYAFIAGIAIIYGPIPVKYMMSKRKKQPESTRTEPKDMKEAKDKAIQEKKP